MDARTQSELVTILPRLRRFALGLTRNGAEADDLVQNACEKAITRIDQWEPGTRLDSWMFRIIQTTHIDQIRGQKRRDSYLEVIEQQGEHAFDGERAAEASMTLDAVRRAIYNLPEEQRAAMLSQVPLGRLGAGDDIANSVLFRASGGGDYITGETLTVNGGMVMD